MQSFRLHYSSQLQLTADDDDEVDNDKEDELMPAFMCGQCISVSDEVLDVIQETSTNPRVMDRTVTVTIPDKAPMATPEENATSDLVDGDRGADDADRERRWRRRRGQFCIFGP
jgi:hypothetical protein